MERLKEKLSKYRFSPIIVVLFVFCAVAFVLFIERSGIDYNYNKPSLDFLPKEKIVTKNEANKSLDIDTLLLYDSTKPDSKEAFEEFKYIFSDMKVGFKALDMSKSEFPKLKDYKKAVILLSDLSPLGQDVITIRDWIYDGGKAQFSLTIQKNIYSSVLENALGILDASWGNANLESIYIDDGFMVGGNKKFIVEDGYDSSWAVRLDSKKTKTYAWIGNENKNPLIWEAKYGKGKTVCVNIGLYEKVVRGFYASAYSLLDDVSIYPVINASTFYLDDFPSQIPDGNSEFIQRDYQRSIRDFYVNIWWPDMMNFADKHNIKYTGLAIMCYDDKIDGSTPSKADEGTFLNFGNMLLRQGGEIGYHGYNHQPLCMSECDYEGLYDYKTWKNKDAIKKAFESLTDLCDDLFPNVDISLYVPPSNIMSKEGEKALLTSFPYIKTISGIYFPDGDFKYNCTQEFDVLSDGTTYQPRIISSCNLTPFMELALVSELNMHFINSHFTHPDDALDIERGALLGWEKLSENFGKYLDYLYKSAPMIRNFTGSETTGAIQRYVAVNVKRELKKDKLIFKIDNFYDEAYFFVRFNDKDFKSIDGGSLTHLTGNLYLLKAQKSKVVVNLK